VLYTKSIKPCSAASMPQAYMQLLLGVLSYIHTQHVKNALLLLHMHACSHHMRRLREYNQLRLQLYKSCYSMLLIVLHLHVLSYQVCSSLHVTVLA
jgi:hypothetical protein